MKTSNFRVTRMSVLTLLILMATVLMPRLAFADGKNDNAQEIKSGNIVTVTMAQSEVKYFKFVPTEGGVYLFKKDDDVDCDPDFYVNENEVTNTDPDKQEIQFEAKAGNEYYLKVKLAMLPPDKENVTFNLHLILLISEKEQAVTEANKLIAEARDFARDLDKSMYTEESYKALTDAIAKLQALLDDSDSKTDDINKAIAELNEALEGLKTRESADREKAVEDANKAIKQARDLDKNKYTDESYKAVTDAVAKLVALLDNPDSKTDDINKATAELNEALKGLKTLESVDREKAVEDANKVIKQANDLDKSKYTDESYKAVTDAVVKLKAMIDDPKSKTDDIIKATEDLRKALSQLKMVENKPAVKKDNTLVVKGKTATVKYNKLKKKAHTFKRTKVITVTSPQGKMTYKKVSVAYIKAKSVKMSKKALKKYKNKAAKKIKINTSTGEFTLKKGLKKGIYKVKVKVMAVGNANYNPSAWKTATIKIKVK